MDNNTRLKQRGLYFFFFFISLVVAFCGIMLFSQLKASEYTKRFWNELDEIMIYNLSANTLNEYESKLKEELENVTHRYEMQKGYFSLGYIEGIKGNYQESNSYYYQALSINPNVSADFLGHLYVEMAVNYLALEQCEEAEKYFEIALQTASKDKQKLTVYQRYALGLMEYTRDYVRVAELFDILTLLCETVYDQIENKIVFAELYAISGEYEQGIEMLKNAFKMSVQYEDERMQQEISVKLSVLFYMIHDYEQVIKILNGINPNFQNDSIQYLKPFIISLYHVEGYEVAMNYLEIYREDIHRFTKEGFSVIELYLLILKANLSLENGQWIEGRNYLSQAMSLLEKVGDAGLELWIEKLYLDSLLLEGMHGEKILLRYVELYQEIQSSKLFYFTKLDLLDEIKEQNMKLGNYVLAYNDLANRRNQFKEVHSESEVIDLNEVYNQVQLELKEDRILKTVNIILLLIMSNSAIAFIVYLFYKNHQEVKLLSQQIKLKEQRESLTQTLTKKALYESLNAYLGQENEFTFIVLQYDEFKRYNEVYGYLAGDEALKILSSHIKTIFENEYISRHLGNSFIIVSYHEKEACIPSLMLLMQTIYDLNLEKRTNLKEGRLTISAGVCSGRINSETSIDQLILVATKNLEKSKRRGNNKFTCS